MSCEPRRDLIIQLVAGGLDPRERTELRSHLATGCATCEQSLVEAQ